MKQGGFLSGMALLAAMGIVHAATDDETMPGLDAVSVGDGNAYMTDCTKAGVAEDLSGDELDVYVQDCMEDMGAAQQTSDEERS